MCESIKMEDFKMDKFVFDKINGLWYELHGDYYLPCVTVPDRKAVGFFGNRYRNYLKHHKTPVYTAMLLAGSLEEHVADIDRQAEEMLDRLITQMAQREGVTEHLKASEPLEWARQMNNIRNRAVEVVNADLIYN